MDQAPVTRSIAHSNPSEVVALLVSVIRSKAAVIVTCTAGTLRATMDMIDPTGNYFILTIDGTPDQVAAATKSDKLVFEVRAASTRLEFAVNGSDVRQAQGDCVLLVQVPKLLLRFDRRRSRRVALPQGHAVRCSLPLKDGLSVLPRTFEVVDISAGGVAIMFSNGPKLQTGEVFESCALKLPGVGTVSVGLEMRHVVEITNDGVTTTRIGCRFVALSADAQAAILRYIAIIEQELGTVSLDFADLAA